MVMVTVFVICWGPYAAQSLAGVMDYVSQISDPFTTKLFPSVARSSGPLCVPPPVCKAGSASQPSHLRHHEQDRETDFNLLGALLRESIFSSKKLSSISFQMTYVKFLPRGLGLRKELCQTPPSDEGSSHDSLGDSGPQSWLRSPARPRRIPADTSSEVLFSVTDILAASLIISADSYGSEQILIKTNCFFWPYHLTFQCSYEIVHSQQ